MYDGSASFSDSGFSHLTNPVFTDVPESSFFSYRYFHLTGEKKGNHFIAGKILGFSLTYARFNNYSNTDNPDVVDKKSDYYNISRGFFLNNFLGFGAGYSFARSDIEEFDSFKSWDIGLLLRPFTFMSLGAVFRDYNGKTGIDEIRRSDIYSLSIRPFGRRLTLSADAERFAGDNRKEMTYSFSVNMIMPYEISLFARGDKESNFTFGVKLPFYLRRGESAGLKLEAYSSNFKDRSTDFYSMGFSYTDRINEKAVIAGPGRSMLYIKLDQGFGETSVDSFFEEKETVFYDLLKGMDEALKDRGIDGVIVQVDNAELGFAQLQELRNGMRMLRIAGKKVYTILTETGNKEYFIASESDKIYLTPNSSFSLQGLKAEVYFFREFADKAGLKFESLRRGKYKSFAEPWTRDRMSPEFRENMNKILGDLNEQFLGSISKSRGMAREKLDEILTAGIFTPEEAREKKFVDEIMYPDEAMEDIGKDINTVNLRNYLSENKSLDRWGTVPVVAVVYIDGSIIRGKSSITRYIKSIGDESYEKVMESVFRDGGVKAVVLRIDSGGGSAAAADYMWRSLVKLKEQYKKPVVISFGNSAASGGYYIACTGDRIFSSPGTITGSIGVVFGKLSLKELYGKLGINKEVIKMSHLADILSESRTLTENEKSILQKSIDFTYRRFLDRVMEARKISKNEIESVSEGRIFTGSQAGKNRLVDEIGGLSAAIEYARVLGKIKGKYTVKGLPEYLTFINGIVQSNSLEPVTRFISTVYRDIKLDLLMNSDVLYLFPYIVKIR